MYSPFCVWIVAPVVIPMSCPGTSAKSKRRNRLPMTAIASSSANWSPTHLRGPPLNGMYLRARSETHHLPAQVGKCTNQQVRAMWVERAVYLSEVFDSLHMRAVLGAATPDAFRWGAYATSSSTRECRKVRRIITAKEWAGRVQVFRGAR